MISIKTIEPTEVPNYWKVIFVDANEVETVEIVSALDYAEASLKVSNLLFNLKKQHVNAVRNI